MSFRGHTTQTMLYSIGWGTVALSEGVAAVHGTGKFDGIYRHKWTPTFVMVTHDVMTFGQQALGHDEIAYASLVLNRTSVPYFKAVQA